MRISLYEDDCEVYIKHYIRNVGLWPVVLAPWCITMMAAGGVCVMPQTKEATGLLPNRTIALWPYSEMNDPRVTWGKKFIVLRQDEARANAFKLGYNNQERWAAYFNKGQVFIKYISVEEGVEYPDGGCNFESYTNGTMLEIESLGPLAVIEPGEEIMLLEQWDLFEESEAVPDCEDGIAELVTKHLPEGLK
jgi:hypothetical protein